MTRGTAISLDGAKQQARKIDGSDEYARFVNTVYRRFPWRTKLNPAVLERDYLRVVDHHLKHLMPHVVRCMDPDVRQVLDFGCGSGGSSIALALTHPEVRCYGTDIDGAEIEMARERAAMYGVADRCEFHHVEPGTRLPFPDDFFDFSLCSSVLEYATRLDIRTFCVREMARLVAVKSSLFFSVPNRLYPFEIHTGRWGWNYFPRLTRARIVDSTFWEIRRLARPYGLTLHRTPVSQLLTPWTNFCVRRDA